MKYLIQVRFNGADAVIHALRARSRSRSPSNSVPSALSPACSTEASFEPASAAKTVQLVDGRRTVRGGPAVDPGAALDGYYLYETDDEESALAFAARIPVARMGGTVEVRPLMERQ